MYIFSDCINVLTHMLVSLCEGAMSSDPPNVVLPPVCPGYRGEAVHSDQAPDTCHIQMTKSQDSLQVKDILTPKSITFHGQILK